MNEDHLKIKVLRRRTGWKTYWLTTDSDIALQFYPTEQQGVMHLPWTSCAYFSIKEGRNPRFPESKYNTPFLPINQHFQREARRILQIKLAELFCSLGFYKVWIELSTPILKDKETHWIWSVFKTPKYHKEQFIRPVQKLFTYLSVGW